jgi:hypothetical protein
MERLVPNSSIRQRKAISASERPFLDAIARIVAEHVEVDRGRFRQIICSFTRAS